MIIGTVGLILTLLNAPTNLLLSTTAHAQDDSGYRYQPPPPVAGGIPGSDFQDDDIEEIEGDSIPGRPSRPNFGVPSPNDPSADNRQPPNVPTFRGAPTTFNKTGNGANAIRFEVLSDEFFEKGKRRGRVTDLKKPRQQNQD